MIFTCLTVGRVFHYRHGRDAQRGEHFQALDVIGRGQPGGRRYGHGPAQLQLLLYGQLDILRPRW
jgi:hypothetical protein